MFKRAIKEIAKIHWLEKKELLKTSSIVLLTIIGTSLISLGLDSILAILLKLFK